MVTELEPRSIDAQKQIKLNGEHWWNCRIRTPFNSTSANATDATLFSLGCWKRLHQFSTCKGNIIVLCLLKKKPGQLKVQTNSILHLSIKAKNSWIPLLIGLNFPFALCLRMSCDLVSETLRFNFYFTRRTRNKPRNVNNSKMRGLAGGEGERGSSGDAITRSRIQGAAKWASKHVF